jgi:AcrR family transcriptional regulator
LATAGEKSTARIIEAATTLFADHGFEGVSTRQIAAATGLNIATVHHHVGSKHDLYLAVLDRFYAREEALVDALIGRVDDTVVRDREALKNALFELIDALLDFARAHPERQRLYVRRWLEESAELEKREATLTLRLYRQMDAVLQRAMKAGVVRADLDTGNFLRSFDWMVCGYFATGAFSWRNLRADPRRKSNLDTFRNYLKDYTEHLLEI